MSTGEIDRLNAEALAYKTINSAGKSRTPNGLTRDIIVALLKKAGLRGMSAKELADGFSHRKSKSPHMLADMLTTGRIRKHEGRYYLP